MSDPIYKCTFNLMHYNILDSQLNLPTTVLMMMLGKHLIENDDDNYDGVNVNVILSK